MLAEEDSRGGGSKGRKGRDQRKEGGVKITSMEGRSLLLVDN